MVFLEVEKLLEYIKKIIYKIFINMFILVLDYGLMVIMIKKFYLLMNLMVKFLYIFCYKY